MPMFPAIPCLEPVDDAHRMVTHPYIVAVGGVPGVSAVVVMPGFVTDGASVPAVLRRWYGEPYEAPRIGVALVHDWLYTAQILPRSVCDRLYFKLMREAGYGRIRAATEYTCLRLFGGRYWNAVTESERNDARRLGMVVP